MPAGHPTAQSGIYAIRHVASGKLYIGSAVDIHKRWLAHRSGLRLGRHHSPYLQRAWDKYGPDAFAWEIIQVVEDGADLLKAEQDALDRFESYRRPNGYNIGREAGAAFTGRRHTKASRAKMSANMKGKNKGRIPEGVIKAWAANTGRPLSPEHRAKISAANRRRTITPETREKHAAALRGRKGRPITPEHRAKLNAARRGKPLSEEHRAKIAEAGKGRTHSPETKAKMSAARRAYWARRKAAEAAKATEVTESQQGQ